MKKLTTDNLLACFDEVTVCLQGRFVVGKNENKGLLKGVSSMKLDKVPTGTEVVSLGRPEDNLFLELTEPWVYRGQRVFRGKDDAGQEYFAIMVVFEIPHSTYLELAGKESVNIMHPTYIVAELSRGAKFNELHFSTNLGARSLPGVKVRAELGTVDLASEDSKEIARSQLELF